MKQVNTRVLVHRSELLGKLTAYMTFENVDFFQSVNPIWDSVEEEIYLITDELIVRIVLKLADHGKLE